MLCNVESTIHCICLLLKQTTILDCLLGDICHFKLRICLSKSPTGDKLYLLIMPSLKNVCNYWSIGHNKRHSLKYPSLLAQQVKKAKPVEERAILLGRKRHCALQARTVLSDFFPLILYFFPALVPIISRKCMGLNAPVAATVTYMPANTVWTNNNKHVLKIYILDSLVKKENCILCRPLSLR